MISTILIVAAVLAQSDQSPWVIHLDDGARIVAYCEESDFEKDIFTVQEDKPWAGPRVSRTLFKKDVKGHYPAGAAELAAYYARGWESNGGIQVDTPNGKIWVFEEEYELAQRAAEMARANDKSEREQASTSAPAISATPTPAEHTPSFGKLWGAHVAVLTVGLGLSGLVAWFLVLE